MRIGCDTKTDAVELLRAVGSWLGDPACVVPDHGRNDAMDALAELVASLRGVTLHSRSAPPG